MKVYWTARYGSGRKSEATFQGPNAKRSALRLVKRFGGTVKREVVPGTDRELREWGKENG